jgi:hypothetical protein
VAKTARGIEIRRAFVVGPGKIAVPAEGMLAVIHPKTPAFEDGGAAKHRLLVRRAGG